MAGLVILILLLFRTTTCSMLALVHAVVRKHLHRQCHDRKKMSATRDGNLSMPDGWCKQCALPNGTHPAHAYSFFVMRSAGL